MAGVYTCEKPAARGGIPALAEEGSMHISMLAGEIRCSKCNASNALSNWPVNGDHVAWYCQDQPGAFSLDVHCAGCGHHFFVVWDRDPGPVRALDLDLSGAGMEAVDLNRPMGNPPSLQPDLSGAGREAVDLICTRCSQPVAAGMIFCPGVGLRGCLSRLRTQPGRSSSLRRATLPRRRLHRRPTASPTTRRLTVRRRVTVPRRALGRRRGTLPMPPRRSGRRTRW
jgi:hypothetical protein